MKGQAINIDWTVGLSIFLVTSLSSVFLITTPNSLVDIRMENALYEVSRSLEQETFIEGRTTNLSVRTPIELDRNIPVDRSYSYRVFNSSGTMNTVSNLDFEEDGVKAVVRAKNTSYSMTYTDGELDEPTYSTDLSTDSNQISNSKISLETGSPGLTSLQVNGNELLNNNADLGYSDYTVNQEEISASSFNRNLTVFSNSSEIIIEDVESATFNLENLSTLYWYSDDSTTSLEGEVSKSGDTKGLTIASDYGITFLGDLNAQVNKQAGSDTVEVQVTAERLRLMLHNSDYTEGKNRIEMYNQSEIYFGASQSIEGSTEKKIQELVELNQKQFEERLGLGKLGYNITYGIPGTADQTAFNTIQKVAQQEEWNHGNFERTSSDGKDNSGELRIGYRNGSTDTELTEGLVGYWRMDRNVNGDGGTVKDYSRNSNDGVTYGNLNTGQRGIFSTEAFKFEGHDDYVRVEDNSNLVLTSEFTISFWMKPTGLTDTQWNTVIDKRTPNSWEGYIIQWNSGKDKPLRLYSDVTNAFHSSYKPNDNLGEWAHVILRFNGSEYKFFIDGEGDTSMSEQSLNPSSEPLLISQGNYQDEYYQGLLEEVLIYNRSLSEDEIQQLYFNGRDGKFKGNYTASRTGNDEEKNWSKVEIDALVPSETSLSARLDAYNEFGNNLDRQWIDVEDGENNYTLNLYESERVQLRFNGTSSNVTRTWEVDEFRIYSENQEQSSIIRKGEEIPLEDTFVRNSESALIRQNGNLTGIENRVVLWP